MSNVAFPALPRRYPLRAIAAVALAWLVFVVQVFFGAFVCILFLPLVPFFIGLVVSSAGLLSAAHAYARSVAEIRVEPATLSPGREARPPKSAAAARAA